MEQLRVPRLLAGALAAVSGAVVASFFEVEGTLIGAALGSLLVAPAETLYTHSLVSAHTVARRSLLRRAGEQAGANEEGASRARPQPIRWRRVAVAALLAFGIAVGVITGVEALARQPLASCLGAGRGRGRAHRWVWSSPEQTGRSRRQPGRRDVDHVAVGARTDDDGAGRRSHNDRADGDGPQHHGRNHHVQHNPPEHAQHNPPTTRTR
jgi:hypothetical protein